MTAPRPAVALLLLACAAAAGCGTGTAGDVASGAGAAATARVERVVDGDTIIVRTGSGTERVRLIGVDTPETVKPNSPIECFGPQASAETKRLLTGRSVRLEIDVEPRDDYGRALAWVFREPDGLLVNEALVRGGYGERFRRTPNQRYMQRLVSAERRARSEGAGLWGACPSR